MVDLQSTNRTKLSKVRETTFGTIPTSPGFVAVRNTSSGLNANPQTVVSNEIREDRQLTDLILVGKQAGGDIGGELSFEAFDDDLEEALQGTWDTNPYIENLVADTQISDVSTTTLTVASALGSAFVTGMYCLTADFTTAANNKLARVSSSSSTTVVFPASTFTAEAAVPLGASIRMVGFQGASGDITATTVSGNALLSTLLDFTTLNINAGEWLYIGDGSAGNSFANTAADNGWVRVSAVSANRIDLDIVPSGWATDAGTSKTIVVFKGDFIINASTKRSNTFERQFLDHSPTSYEYFTGQTLNQLSIQFGTQSIINLTKSYVGADTYITEARVSGATDTDAPTGEVMNTSDDVGSLLLDGSEIVGPNFVMSMTLLINNNIRLQNAIGSLGAVGTGNGEFNVSLSQFQTYFGSHDLYDKLLDNESFGLTVKIHSPSANNESYVFDLPKIQMQTGAPAVTGKNGDVMLDGSAQALIDDDLEYTISIGRYWYLPSAATLE